MFTQPMLQKRLERAYAALNEFDVDLWVMLGRETHFTPEPAMLYLLPASVLPLTALVISKKGAGACVVGAIDSEEIEAYGPQVEVVTYRLDFEDQLLAVLKRFMPARRIALDFSEVDPSADGLSYTQYRRLTRLLDVAGFDGELISSTNIMKRVRGQKSPEEVAGIEHTVLAAMKIYDEARDFIRSGLGAIISGELAHGFAPAEEARLGGLAARARELYSRTEPVPFRRTTHPGAQWYGNAGFGLFMHWGIHSVAGLDPSWAMKANIA